MEKLKCTVFGEVQASDYHKPLKPTDAHSNIQEHIQLICLHKSPVSFNNTFPYQLSYAIHGYYLCRKEVGYSSDKQEGDCSGVADDKHYKTLVFSLRATRNFYNPSSEFPTTGGSHDPILYHIM